MVTRNRWLSMGMVGVLLLAAFLRIIALSFGQPDPAYNRSLSPLIHQQTPLHPDEYFYVAIPLEMRAKESLNPRFFENPSFLIYLNYFVQGSAAKNWIDPTILIRENLNIRNYAPFPLYVISRYFSALGGMLAVAGTIGLGKRWSGQTAGLLAGLLASISLPLVQHSHYATTSGLASGFVMLSLWACSMTISRRDARWLWLAGLSAGLAASNRYNAGAVSLSVLCAGLIVIYQVRSWRISLNVFLGWGLFPAAFLLTSPYIVLDFQEFWGQFSAIYLRYKSSGVEAACSGLWLEYRYIMLLGFGGIAVLWGVIGCWWLWKADRWQLLIVLVYLIPYSLVVLNNQRVETGDQLTVVVIPVFAALAGYGLAKLRIKNPAVMTGIVILTLITPIMLTGQFLQLLRKPDTRLTAQEWFYQHIPPGASVFLIGGYNVPLDSSDYDLVQQFGLQIPENPTPADYVILSDAALLNASRRSGQSFDTVVQAYTNQLQNWSILTKISRPRQLFDTWLVNNAAYWHHPGIWIYCTNEFACDEAQQ